MSIPEPIALIDMDGTLCDYDGAMRRGMETLRDPEREPSLPTDLWELERHPHIKARMDLIKNQPGWWRGLARLEVNFEILHVIRQMYFDIHILTKGPWRTTSAWSEKVEWCRKHVPTASVHIGEDKGLVYGKVLMDDYPPYIQRWLTWRPRGLVIMPAHFGNKDFTHPNVIRWDGTPEARAEIERRLWEVRQTALYTAENFPEIVRVGGDAECPECHEPYRTHPLDLAALAHDRQPYLHIACDGRRLKL